VTVPAQSADYYLKLLIGDTITTVAILRAELEQTKDQLVAAHAALEAAGIALPEPPARVTPFPAAASS